MRTNLNSRLTDLLNSHNLLHSGLAVSSVTASVAGSEMVFSFILTNKDQTDLLILDPEKTDPGLSFQVAHDELFQGGARVWLGEIRVDGILTIR